MGIYVTAEENDVCLSICYVSTFCQALTMIKVWNGAFYLYQTCGALSCQRAGSYSALVACHEDWRNVDTF